MPRPPLIFEPHTHTNFSDGMNYKLMVKASIKLGVDVLTITDHNTMKGIEPARKFASLVNKKYNSNLIIIPGEEVEIENDIEILAYFLNEPIKAKLSMGEAVDQIHDQDGLVALPHPFRPPLNYKKSFNLLEQYSIDGIEIWNFNFPPFLNKRSCALAKKFPKKFQVGGSDAHFYWMLKMVKNYLYAEPDLESIRKAIIKNQIKVENNWKALPFFMFYFHRFVRKHRKELRDIIFKINKKNFD